jgi:hypothetical protein
LWAGSEEDTMPEMEQTEGQDAQQTAGQDAPETEMCCDGEKTAEQHRHESSDGKCCIDK